MLFPALHDTILALSSAPVSAPLGLLRLSGPKAIQLMTALNIDPPRFVGPSTVESCGRMHCMDLELPARVTWFQGPRSYTGQDLVEISTIGSAPLLNQVCGYLINCGARRALPGEFTARAFLNGRLRVEQIEVIAQRIQAADRSTIQLVSREPKGLRKEIESVRERLLSLLSRIEAGIDFSDEEDIRFITSTQARDEIGELVRQLAGLPISPGGALNPTVPHIAFLGLPNAGKSSLFNCLLDSDRALTGPLAGTTRDVVRAECTIGGVRCVLMDCAGFEAPSSEIQRFATAASDRGSELADLILWVHDRSQPWSEEERRRLASLEHERVLVVLSKSDLAPARDVWIEPGLIEVAARTGLGINTLLDRMHSHFTPSEQATADMGVFEAQACLERALDLVTAEKTDLQNADLIVVELKTAHNFLESSNQLPVAEQVLERIFRKFCIGK